VLFFSLIKSSDFNCCGEEYVLMEVVIIEVTGVVGVYGRILTLNGLES
jgi:hypothetical protein